MGEFEHVAVLLQRTAASARSHLAAGAVDDMINKKLSTSSGSSSVAQAISSNKACCDGGPSSGGQLITRSLISRPVWLPCQACEQQQQQHQVGREVMTLEPTAICSAKLARPQSRRVCWHLFELVCELTLGAVIKNKGCNLLHAVQAAMPGCAED